MRLNLEIISEGAESPPEMDTDTESSGRESGVNGDDDSDPNVTLNKKEQAKRKRYLKSKERNKSRCNHAIEYKLSILDELKRGAKLATVCKQNNLSHGTVCGWKKNELKWRALLQSGRDGYKQHRERNSYFPEVDAALLKWFSNQRAVNPTVSLSGDVMMEAAKQ